MPTRTASAGEIEVLESIAARIMREGGFPGTVSITRAHRLTKGGYSAHLSAHYAGFTRKYRVRYLRDGAVKITQAGEAVRAA